MLSFRKIDRTVHHLQRMREIIAVAVRYGFEDVVAETRLKSLISTLRIRINPAVVERSRWERIRMMLEELGPTFVKFGQLLSNRPDVVPLPLVRELEKLQDRVKPFPASEAEAALEKAWGKPWREVLERFDETPVASASMAQVHHAVLRDGHRRVALKIRRPGIAKTVDVDLEILRNFAAWADGRFGRRRHRQRIRLRRLGGIDDGQQRWPAARVLWRLGVLDDGQQLGHAVCVLRRLGDWHDCA